MAHDHMHDALTFVEGLGHASSCATLVKHRPTPIRYVWHHILPQVCGGQTVSSNLVPLCDNCHYSVHVLLWLLGQHDGATDNIIRWRSTGTPAQRYLAMQGYQAALTAGTVTEIPKVWSTSS